MKEKRITQELLAARAQVWYEEYMGDLTLGVNDIAQRHGCHRTTVGKAIRDLCIANGTPRANKPVKHDNPNEQKYIDAFLEYKTLARAAASIGVAPKTILRALTRRGMQDKVLPRGGTARAIDTTKRNYEMHALYYHQNKTYTELAIIYNLSYSHVANIIENLIRKGAKKRILTVEKHIERKQKMQPQDVFEIAEKEYGKKLFDY